MAEEEMKRTKLSVLVLLLGAFMMLDFNTTFAMDSAAVKKIKRSLSGQIDKNGKASAKVKSFAKKALMSGVANPAFVTAVTTQNAKGVSLDEIKKIDTAWKNAEDFLPIHDEKMENPCAEAIRSMAKTFPAIFEAFVMDNQGANVCQNELTSDYWQGDEAKWKNSFKGGQGGVDVGTEKLDKSTNEVLQQVSLPIVNQAGVVIGAITYGIKTGSL